MKVKLNKKLLKAAKLRQKEHGEIFVKALNKGVENSKVGK